MESRRYLQICSAKTSHFCCHFPYKHDLPTGIITSTQSISTSLFGGKSSRYNKIEGTMKEFYKMLEDNPLGGLPLDMPIGSTSTESEFSWNISRDSGSELDFGEEVVNLSDKKAVPDVRLGKNTKRCHRGKGLNTLKHLKVSMKPLQGKKKRQSQEVNEGGIERASISSDHSLSTTGSFRDNFAINKPANRKRKEDVRNSVSSSLRSRLKILTKSFKIYVARPSSKPQCSKKGAFPVPSESSDYASFDQPLSFDDLWERAGYK